MFFIEIFFFVMQINVNSLFQINHITIIMIIKKFVFNAIFIQQNIAPQKK